MVPLSVITWVVYANRKAAALEALRGTPDDSEDVEYMPLVMLDRGRCLNLELLAEHRQEYTLAGIEGGR